MNLHLDTFRYIFNIFIFSEFLEIINAFNIINILSIATYLGPKKWSGVRRCGGLKFIYIDRHTEKRDLYLKLDFNWPLENKDKCGDHGCQE